MEYPDQFKQKCRDLVAFCLKEGLLQKPNKCEKCRLNPAGHAHHDDYMQPLMVKWLCCSCHRKIHGDEQTAEACRIISLPNSLQEKHVSPLEFSNLTDIPYPTVINRLQRGHIKGVKVRIGSRELWQINPNDYLPQKENIC
jgi:hypothetical protein